MLIGMKVIDLFPHLLDIRSSASFVVHHQLVWPQDHLWLSFCLLFLSDPFQKTIRHSENGVYHRLFFFSKYIIFLYYCSGVEIQPDALSLLFPVPISQKCLLVNYLLTDRSLTQSRPLLDPATNPMLLETDCKTSNSPLFNWMSGNPQCKHTHVVIVRCKMSVLLSTATSLDYADSIVCRCFEICEENGFVQITNTRPMLYQFQYNSDNTVNAR